MRVVSRDDLAWVAAAARSLWERLDEAANQADANEACDDSSIDERLAEWSRSAASDREDLFRRRLEWDDIDLAAARRALSDAPPPADTPLPEWTATVAEIVGGTPAFSPALAVLPVFAMIAALPERAAIDPTGPLPFEDVWIPVVVIARRKLCRRLAADLTRERDLSLPDLAERAYAALERGLLFDLSSIGEQALFEEFSRGRTSGSHLRLLFVNESSEKGSNSGYLAFVRRISGDGLIGLFRNYPVLARLAATIVDQWVEGTAELLERLGRDLDAIRRTFATAAKNAGNLVTAIRPRLSDPHNDGRSVAMIMFESGLSVAYKPKGLGTEGALGRLFDWLNRHGAPAPFKVLRCLDRGEYGWAEFAERRACEDGAGAHRFYEGSGALLAVLHALRAVDCHRDNLIACGALPVLVDGECVMHPEARPMDEGEETEEGADGDFGKSVMRTQFLPRWLVDEVNGQALDVSGLGGNGTDQTEWTSWRWSAVNRDEMQQVPTRFTFGSDDQEPTFDGVTLRPEDHVDDLIAGFRKTYRHLVACRNDLMAAEGPLAAFRSVRVRFIFRATRVYMMLLQRAARAQSLRDGIAYSIALDGVARGFLDAPARPRAWPIARAELRALERMDVPCFTASPERAELRLEEGTAVPQYFVAPSYDQVVAQLEAFSETDLEVQTAIIRGAFEAREADNSHAAAPASGLRFDAAASPLTPDELAAEAEAIAREVSKSGFRTSNGELRWLGLRRIPGTNRHQLTPLDDSLYDGNCGIALFLAAVSHVTGGACFGERAIEALRPVRGHLRDPRRGVALNHAGMIGAGLGLGSVVYTLVNTHRFLGEPSLLDDAQRAAELITDETIAGDSTYDVLGGSAGAILSLLALERASGFEPALARAVACGEHLLAGRATIDGSPRAWRTVSRVPLTGLAHGAAGIAYALLKLHEATGDDRYREAAAEGIAYERSLFSPSVANWPDLRDEVLKNAAEPPFACGWCAGAPGIGLARIGTLSIFDGPSVREDATAAVETTAAFDPTGVDHICCGNMGRVETLWVAGAKLGRDDLQVAAEKQAAWVVARARDAGGYFLVPGLSVGSSYPSLFSGISGIGYQLLRLGFPAKVPSVLLWN